MHIKRLMKVQINNVDCRVMWWTAKWSLEKVSRYDKQDLLLQNLCWKSLIYLLIIFAYLLINSFYYSLFVCFWPLANDNYIAEYFPSFPSLFAIMARSAEKMGHCGGTERPQRVTVWAIYLRDNFCGWLAKTWLGEWGGCEPSTSMREVMY